MTTTQTLPAIDYTVDSCKSSMSSAAKRGLRIMLLAATANRCALCGDPLNLNANAKDADRCEMSHVVPACNFTNFDVKMRPGFLSQNIFAGCGRCNDWTSNKDLTNLYNKGLFAIPEGVIVWNRTEAGRIGRENAVVKNVNNDKAAFYANLDANL